MILPLDILRLALSTLRERRIRAILTILGIAIGPAAMVTIIGTVEGYSQVITGQLSQLGQNTILVLSTSKYTVSDNDIRYIKGLRMVSDAIPFYLTQGTFRRSDGKIIKVNLFAADIRKVFNAMGSFRIENGSIPPESAYSSAVVGHDVVYDDKGNRILRLGQVISVAIPHQEDSKIKIRIKVVRIEGVLERYGNALIVNPDTTIFLPKSAGPAILGLNKYSGIMVCVSDSRYVGILTDQLRERYGNLAEVISFKKIADVIGCVVNVLNFLLYSLSLSAFAVAITGIMATMFASVIERTREIGVLKAIGFSSFDVLITILSEAFIMSLIGGLIGVFLGTIGAFLLASRSLVVGTVVITASPAITPMLIGESIGLAILVGVLGGLIPAYKASRVPPVEALRYE